MGEYPHNLIVMRNRSEISRTRVWWLLLMSSRARRRYFEAHRRTGFVRVRSSGNQYAAKASLGK
jgi:hypothetical protein